MIQPLRPVGDAARPVQPGGVPPPASDFSARLGERLREDPRLSPVLRYAEAALGGPATEARLLETYDALSADRALFEVRTPQGAFRVIQSQSGSFSHYPA